VSRVVWIEPVQLTVVSMEVGVGVVTHEVLDANPVAVETGRSVPVSHSRSPDTVAPSSGNGRERATISFPPINAAQPKEPEQITR
jgi:hypothetical protein